jgi:L-histidine Nalpha-methyltransferase / hercynylcysteine S-oxide synthase
VRIPQPGWDITRQRTELTHHSNLRKIEILLSAIDKLGKKVDYYALDLSVVELERTLEAVPQSRFTHVRCFGLHGTYDDGLEWLKSEEVSKVPKAVLSMGSSIGNFAKPDAGRFLNSFASTLKPGDCLLVGIDACQDPRKVFHAYNDMDGLTHKFVLNGLEHANELLGSHDFDTNTWRVFGEYRYDEQGGRHVAFVSPARDVTIDGVTIRQDEKIKIEESHKFSAEETNQVFCDAGLVQGVRWANQQGDYGMCNPRLK